MSATGQAIDCHDGIVALDSEFARSIGFTSDRFSRDSYLWRIGQSVIVSLIESRLFGNFGKLCYAILDLGFEVHVSTPLGAMQRIVSRNGFHRRIVKDEDMGCDVEVWVLSPEDIR